MTVSEAAEKYGTDAAGVFEMMSDGILINGGREPNGRIIVLEREVAK